MRNCDLKVWHLLMVVISAMMRFLVNPVYLSNNPVYRLRKRVIWLGRKDYGTVSLLSYCLYTLAFLFPALDFLLHSKCRAQSMKNVYVLKSAKAFTLWMHFLPCSFTALATLSKQIFQKAETVLIHEPWI